MNGWGGTLGNGNRDAWLGIPGLAVRCVLEDAEGELRMGMFGRTTFAKNVRCKHCRQKSPLKSVDWEALGKSQGWLIVACLRCGHGLRMGVFSERHISKELLDDMRKAKEEYLEEMDKRIEQ